MLARALGIRPRERRAVAVGFGVLTLMIGAHAMLETARDALFLQRLPASDLPLAYLAIAVLALLVSELNQRATKRFPPRFLLSASLLAGGLVTGAFWFWTAQSDAWVLGALYVWTGLFATVVVVQYWLLLGDVLDITRAKRLFALIGAGGLIGATAGSAAAGGLLAWFGGDGRLLLLVAGGTFIVASVVPLGFAPRQRATAGRRRGRGEKPASGGVGMLIGDRYLLRLFAMVLVAAVLATGVDYAFKATVASAAARQGWELGPFFARYYAVVNGIALVVQVLVAPRLLRAVGVDRALLLLPALLLLGSAGFFITVGLLPALLLKGTDGVLRHSVYRTASEILYLPLARDVRGRFKGFADAVGQRGGQALASVLLLAVAALGVELHHLGVALIVLALIWLACLVGLQPHYLELFRKQLRQGTLQTDVDVPDLDLASFETLVGALSSEDDAEVLAALEMFAGYGKTDLVPALILYHPSPDVVLRSFELFARTDRTDVLRLTSRLLRHDDPEIRAAALRMVAGAQPDEKQLRRFLGDDSPVVRCTALAGLIGAGFADEREMTTALRRMVDGDCGDTRRALARSLRHLPADRFAWVGVELARVPEPGLAAEVANAMAAAPDERYLPVLVEMLAARESRSEARRALVAVGQRALDHLEEALSDDRLAGRVRRHVPRTISRFATDRAAAILFARLERERDEAVLFKILRGLGRMRAADPALPIERERLLSAADRSMRRAVTALHWRLAVQAVLGRSQAAATPAAELLVALLTEKESDAVERVFRLLHILEPTERFRMIYHGLRSQEPKVRSSSLELLAHVVPRPLRDGILAMVDDGPAEDRLQAAAALFPPDDHRAWRSALAEASDGGPEILDRTAVRRAYAAMLRQMLSDPSETLRSIVGYHAAEQGMDQLRDDVAAMADKARDAMAEVAGDALELLSPASRTEADRAG